QPPATHRSRQPPPPNSAPGRSQPRTGPDPHARQLSAAPATASDPDTNEPPADAVQLPSRHLRHRGVATVSWIGAGRGRPVLSCYATGSRIAQAVARARPDLVRELVVSPPVPGIGDRILSPQAQQEFWYQPFHQLALSTQLIEGQPDMVRAYLRHCWSHWSGPDFELDHEHLEHLVSMYGRPGAFAASVAWYRAGAGSVATSVAERVPAPAARLAVPATVLWPAH